MWFAWVIAVIIVIAIKVWLAALAAGIARDKGYEEGSWGWICFFFGIVGYILVAAMPDLKTREELRRSRQNSSNGNSGNWSASAETEARSRQVPVLPDYNADTQWRCKECGARNSRDSMFCRDCGAYR